MYAFFTSHLMLSSHSRMSVVVTLVASKHARWHVAAQKIFHNDLSSSVNNEGLGNTLRRTFVALSSYIVLYFYLVYLVKLFSFSDRLTPDHRATSIPSETEFLGMML